MKAQNKDRRDHNPFTIYSKNKYTGHRHQQQQKYRNTSVNSNNTQHIKILPAPGKSKTPKPLKIRYTNHYQIATKSVTQTLTQLPPSSSPQSPLSRRLLTPPHPPFAEDIDLPPKNPLHKPLRKPLRKPLHRQLYPPRHPSPFATPTNTTVLHYYTHLRRRRRLASLVGNSDRTTLTLLQDAVRKQVLVHGRPRPAPPIIPDSPPPRRHVSAP